MIRRLRWSLAGLVLLSSAPNAMTSEVVIGSKAFTESVILGELANQVINDAGVASRHQKELGGTTILWSSLRRGDIGCYAEYTGTLRAEVYASEAPNTDEALTTLLRRDGVWASPPLGFNDTYVLGMRKEVAQQLSITRMSDLSRQPQLRYAFSNEFLDRADGWPGLRSAYGLQPGNVRGMDHDLAYRALAEGAIDVTDLYSTDAEIPYYGLVTLEDDRHYFPAYDALFICRDDVAPTVKAVLGRLEGTIDAATMARLNAKAKLEHVPETQVAQAFAQESLGLQTLAAQDDRTHRIVRRTLEHLFMVLTSLAMAIAVAVPLGVVAFRRPRLGRVIFGLADVLQTIPALALLVFLIPWFGIGYPAAIIALFVYSLLPVLRNTHTGLADIAGELRESADALGLPRRTQLWRIELPLAFRSILAGIRTAAVINVGTATLGALIGAGGYGQSILTGIRLDDRGLILEGAVPAAALALTVQLLFGAIERRWVRRR